MKCNMSYRNRASKKEKEDIKRYIYEETQKYIRLENQNCIRRTFKLFAVALNKKYGFGQKRLSDLFYEVGEKQNEIRKENEESYWKHIDDIILNELKLDFKRENYEELDK